MKIHPRSCLLLALFLGASGLTLLGGCGPSLLEEAEPEPVTQRSAIKIANSLSTDALVFNGISTNTQARGMMSTYSLASLFNNTMTQEGNFIRDQLTDPNARRFMKYLVGCALGSDQTLPWQSSGGHSGTWVGGAGLCTQWLNGPPSAVCLNRVSACILTRNSGVNRRIELSLRGKDAQGNALSLEAQPTLVEYSPEPPAAEQPLASFQACASPSTNLKRNCGWFKGNIGKCTPGSWVRLGAGGQAREANNACTAPVLGSSTSAKGMLRVCEGIVGCDDEGARFLARSDQSCSSLQTQPALSFACPASGFFNVMKAPKDSTQQLGTMTVGVEQTPSNGAVYPLSEEQAFPFREGAFYGNLFTGRLASEVTVIRPTGLGDGTRVLSRSLFPGSVYSDMYVCHDPEWTAGAAYATHRVCAVPSQSANCAATVVGSCATVCATSDAPPALGDKDYGSCQDGLQRLWSEPVTVFLNGPCDLMPVDQPGLCGRTTVGSPPVEP
jgi:hypothetical protein